MEEILGRFPEICVAVVGDLMLDQFVYGVVERISPEAPVPVVEVEREVFHLGGAANVVHNLVTLGCRVELVGALGADAQGDLFRTQLQEIGVPGEGLVEVAERPTAVKTRVIAQHQQVVRFDRERNGPLPSSAVRTMVDRLASRMVSLDAVIVSDYGKGVIGPELMGAVLAAARARRVLVAVDPKPPNALLYRGADVITPNVKETEVMAGMPARSTQEAVAAGRALLERLETRAILVTRGERGMTLVEREGDVTHIPTVARDVFDVTGAGDTAISALTLGWAATKDVKEAAALANLAAGIVVGKLGTATVSAEELREAAAGPDRATGPRGRE